jgi:hypothetical protein
LPAWRLNAADDVSLAHLLADYPSSIDAGLFEACRKAALAVAKHLQSDPGGLLAADPNPAGPGQGGK